LLVDAPLALGRPLEVLDHVGHVDRSAVDAGLLERFVEQPARRADKGTPFQVLVIPRLLPDQHDLGALSAFAEHRLGRVLPEIAGAAAGRLLANGLQCGHGTRSTWPARGCGRARSAWR